MTALCGVLWVVGRRRVVLGGTDSDRGDWRGRGRRIEIPTSVEGEGDRHLAGSVGDGFRVVAVNHVDETGSENQYGEETEEDV